MLQAVSSLLLGALAIFAPDILPGVLLMYALVVLMPNENENGAPKNNQGQDFTWGLRDPPGGEEGQDEEKDKVSLRPTTLPWGEDRAREDKVPLKPPTSS